VFSQADVRSVFVGAAFSLLLFDVGPNFVHVEALDLGEQLFERGGREGAGLVEHHDLLAKDHDRWNGADAKAAGELLLSLGVDLAEDDVRVFLGGFLIVRRELFAGAAPVGPKVDDEHAPLVQRLLKVFVRERLGRHGRDSSGDQMTRKVRLKCEGRAGPGRPGPAWPGRCTSQAISVLCDPFMGRLHDRFMHFLKDRFEGEGMQPREDGALVFVLDDDRGHEWGCLAVADEEDERVMFYSVLLEATPAELVAEMMLFTSMANYGMPVGCFELDLVDGEVRFRTALDLEGMELNEVMCTNLVESNLGTMGGYIEGIQAVMRGEKSAKEAISTIEG